MNKTQLPAAFSLLAGQRNSAVDAALVEALPQMESDAKLAALDLLATRDHAPSLALLVTRFQSYDATIQEGLLAHVEALSRGFSLALNSGNLDDRSAGIDLIVRSENYSCADLLADAVRHPCSQTRELAAGGLYALVEQFVSRKNERVSGEPLDSLEEQGEKLAAAMALAVRRWGRHFQPKVVLGALMLGGRVEEVIREKLDEPRSKLVRVVTDLIDSTRDVRLADFVLRALAIPQLRSTAGQTISRSESEPFLREIFLQTDLLQNEAIERGCRWVREGKWIEEAQRALIDLPEAAVIGTLRLVAAMGCSHGRRIELLREMAELQRGEVREAVVTQLARDESHAATELLTSLASRGGDRASELAMDEVRRRHGDRGGMETLNPGMPTPSKGQVAFEKYWESFGELTVEEKTSLGRSIRETVPRLPGLLRVRLESQDSLVRARALRVVEAMGMLEEMEDYVRPLAHDPEPTVRSQAIQMLVYYPGPGSSRTLQSALNDPDPRVQANAMEAIDALDSPDRARISSTKLGSRHARVRANAVKSLFKSDLRQASEALLAMLRDPSPSHRISALWVIERMHLATTWEAIHELSRNDGVDRVRRRAERVCRSLKLGSPTVEQGLVSSSSDTTINTEEGNR